ncbi:MAG: cation:proton antiporter, partial [Planctomycetes bacterium]|nr:cation:proton antiporter [Planctomycetota bacterium]
MSKQAARRYLLVPLMLYLYPATAFASQVASGSPAPMPHRMMLLVIQVGIILFAAKFANIFFEKIKLPGALGELIVGIIIGPYALGKIALPGFSLGLFPVPGDGALAISPELYGVSAIAAVVLLFNIGLETDLKLLLRYSVAGGLVGLGGMLASFVMGAASVMLFSKMLFGQSLGLLAPQCIFLGTITTATSVGITARILLDRRKLDSPEGVTILSAAVIDDVLGIVLLAVVMSVVTASRAAGAIDWGHIGIIAAKAVGVWLAATVIGLVAARKISVLLKWFDERTSIAIMALGLALILAGLFEEAGLAMIIGAYIMGLSLSRADISRVVRERLRPIYALLVPVFFCTTGMQIDLGALTSPPVLFFGVVYALVAMLSKLIGCGIPALLTGFNLRGAARIGFGMAPRCEVALIIAGVGLSAHLLSPVILAAVIIMVIVNTVVAPPALVFLFKSPARGTRKPDPGDKVATTLSFEFPSLEMTEFFVDKLSAVFELEGFFVHRISRGRQLYQLRKDKTVIDFSYADTTLDFTCAQTDAPLVSAAVYEALAAMERAARVLREPLDSKSMQAALQDTGPLGPPALSMKQYLTEDLITPELRGTNKVEIIDELLELLSKNGLIKDVEAASRAVWEREESMSTGLQYGVAIPHGKTDAVDHLVCAVGIKKDGVDFDSMDGLPSTIFVLTLSPKSKPAPHVQFMSTVSQILNSAGRKRILSCDNSRQIYNAFVAPILETPVAAPRRPSVKPVPQRFDLADYIKPELVEPDLKGNTPKEIISELLGMLDNAELVDDVQAAREVVLNREAQLSTGMAEGLAIPHGRTNGVDSLVCAIGVKRGGMDFGAADGKRT